MYLLGTTITKLLATVAAFMTITAGMPHTQCRCPNGQIKFFCHGNISNPSGCCSTPTASSPSDGEPCCREAKKEKPPGAELALKRPCCTHTHTEQSKGHENDGSPAKFQAPSCVKTVVAASALDSVENSGTSVQQTIDILALEAPELPVLSVALDAAVATRPPPLSRIGHPNLIVVLCHFTC